MRAPSRTQDRARTLRRKMTPPEVLLWVRLRRRDESRPAFRRQHAAGPYILDFFCAPARLAIEVDGYGHTHDTRVAHDRRRTDYLAELGIDVMRLTAAEVLADPDEAAYRIVQAALARTPPPTASPPPPP